jgi:hypothetical protein
MSSSSIYRVLHQRKPWRLPLWLVLLLGVLLVTYVAPSAYGSSLSKPMQDEVRRDLIRRDFLDPCLGLHWQLMDDPKHPGGPGRLVQLREMAVADAGKRFAEANVASLDATPLKAPLLPVVIRAGERITVEQETPVLHARLTAVALESGAVGDRLRVRLNAGKNAAMGTAGPVIAVVATGKGLARW